MLGDTMTRGKEQELAGFGGYPKAKTELWRPEAWRELDALLTGSGPAIPRGLGRAYGDAAFVHGGKTVLVERLDRMIDFDPGTGLLQAEGGARLDRVIDCFLPQGFFPVVVPGTAQVTLGGLFACDVHGKNHHRDGSFARQVEALTLIDGQGRRRKLSPTKEKQAFYATAGGMGLTGFIQELSLRLMPVESAYLNVDLERSGSLEETLAKMRQDDGAYRYSVSWVDGLARGKHLGRGVLMRGNWCPREELPASLRANPYNYSKKFSWPVPMTPPLGLVHPWNMRIFNEAFYRKHPRKKRRVLQSAPDFFFPLDAVQGWNRLYGPGGFQQYQCVLPMAEAERGLQQLLERIARAGVASFLAVLKFMGASLAEAPLSFPREGAILALDLPHRGAETLALLDELDQIVLARGGRLYLAKDARMSAESFRAMYPELPAWQKVRARLDPKGRLRSAMAERLEMIG